MGGLLLVLAIIAMVVGGSLWLSAFYRVEPVIPEQFRENLSKGAAFQTYVWSNLVPVSVRRRYMSSLVLWVMMLALMGALSSSTGNPSGGWCLPEHRFAPPR